MYKYLLVILFLSSSYLSANDKVLHFTISGIMGGGMESFLYRQTKLEKSTRIALSTAVATLPGLAKEIADSRKKDNKFSTADLAYDAAGAFFGALTSAFLHETVSMSVEEKEASISWSKSF